MKKIFTSSKIKEIARLVGITTTVLDPNTVLLVYGDDIGSYVKVKVNKDSFSICDKEGVEKQEIKDVDKFLSFVEGLI